MIELKPYPFCGEKASMRGGAVHNSFTIWCQCTKCDAKTTGYCPDINQSESSLESIEDCKILAAEKWNKRTN